MKAIPPHLSPSLAVQNKGPAPDFIGTVLRAVAERLTTGSIWIGRSIGGSLALVRNTALEPRANPAKLRSAQAGLRRALWRSSGVRRTLQLWHRYPPCVAPMSKTGPSSRVSHPSHWSSALNHLFVPVSAVFRVQRSSFQSLPYLTALAALLLPFHSLALLP